MQRRGCAQEISLRLAIAACEVQTLLRGCYEIPMGKVGSGAGAGLGWILDVFLHCRVMVVAYAVKRCVALGGRGPALHCAGTRTVALGAARRASAGGRWICRWSGLCDLVGRALAGPRSHADDSGHKRAAHRCWSSFSDAAPRRRTLGSRADSRMNAYGLSFLGKSMPYARSLPSATAKNVTIVPGRPKMKARIRQPLLGLFCARMPA